MLKADFHIHTKEDPQESLIKYSAKELINHAAEKGFNVLAITNHCSVHYNEELRKFALEKGILLIPGIEAEIEGREVVILNASKEIENVKTFSELKEFKKNNPNIFVIAPHPYYPKAMCLKKKLADKINIFDGIEYSHYYCRFFNRFNKKASVIAKENNKPIIGTSDAHRYCQFNKTYSLVDAEMNIDSVINALKNNKIEIKTKPLSYFTCTRIALSVFYSWTRRKLLPKVL